jgi:hypothetical protein
MTEIDLTQYAMDKKKPDLEVEQKLDSVMGRERRYNKPQKKYTRPRLLSELFRNAASHPDPVSYLQSNKHPAVLAVLRALHREWMVIDQPRYQSNRFQDAPTLYENYQRLYLWLDGSPILDAFERNKLFENWLSEMEAEESQFILGVRRGSLPISQDIVHKAFPEIGEQGHATTSSMHQSVRECSENLKILHNKLREIEAQREYLMELIEREHGKLRLVQREWAARECG